MRQPQATTNRKESYRTPEIPEVFLLPVTKSVTGVGPALALNKTNQKKDLIERIHQTVHGLIHQGRRLRR